MIAVDWDRFGGAIRAQALFFALTWVDVEQQTGVSHARMLGAAKGKPVGVPIFLTLCGWMDMDPREFIKAELS